jgi:hypothetical protein
MADQEPPKSTHRHAVLAGGAIGFAVLVFGAFAYLLTGVFTRVIGICSGASAEWTKLYDWLALAVPLVAIGAGTWVHQAIKREHLKKRQPQQEET